MLFRVPEYYVVILRCHEFTMQDKLDGHHKSALLRVALGLVMIGKKVWNRLESVCKRPQLAVKLKVDYGLSLEQIDGVRHMISHKYSRADGNNTFRRRWLTNKFNESRTTSTSRAPSFRGSLSRREAAGNILFCMQKRARARSTHIPASWNRLVCWCHDMMKCPMQKNGR